MFGLFRKNNKFKRRGIRRKKEGAFIPFVSYIAVFIVFIIGFFVLSSISNSTFHDEYKKEREILTNKKVLSGKEEKRLMLIDEKTRKNKIKFEQDLNKINILVVGRGGLGNDAPYLTDSIILVSLNKKNNYISMLSIPRDLYVDFGDIRKNGRREKNKINALYPYYLHKYRIKNKLKGKPLVDKAMGKLEEKITEITGEKIDFYVDLNFKGFVHLINSIGGVTVNVPKNLYDDKYPAANHGYQIFSIRKGINELNGTRALMYVRTRKNTGGDFGRSERQQQVVKGIKEKILNLGYLTSPSKIKKLYNIFDNYIGTDIGVIDAVKIFTDVKLQNNTVVYSSGLNASCIRLNECKKGGFMFYPNREYFGGASVLLAQGTNYRNLSNYKILQKYSDLVFNSPKLFDEMSKISIFSKNKDSRKAEELKYNLIKYGLNVKSYEIIGKIESRFTGKKINIENINLDKINLQEYNELKRRGLLEKIKTFSGSISDKKVINEGVSAEYNNLSTKIIINGIDNNSNTVSFLKKYLDISDNNIIKNPGGPKYAKDKKTQIEIIYINPK